MRTVLIVICGNVVSKREDMWEDRDRAASPFRRSCVLEPLDSELPLRLSEILEDMRNLSLTFFILSSLVVVCPQSGSAQSASGAVAIAEISANLGTCCALITVTGADSKPIYSAKVCVQRRLA